MKILKKANIIICLLVVGMIISLMGCGTSTKNGGTTESENTNEKYTLRIAVATSGANPQNFTMEKFKELLEAETDQIVVELYPSGQLGTLTSQLQSVQDGSLEASIMPASYFSSFAFAASIVDLPYTFSSDELYNVLNDEDCILNDYMKKKGYVVGGWLRMGSRYILSDSEIKSMDDMKNKKIWCLPSTILQNEMKAYGASTATLDLGDLAVALQNGTIDGCQADVLLMAPMKLYESTKYLNLIPGSGVTSAFVFSDDWMSTLPKNIQDLILKVAKNTIVNYEYDYAVELINNCNNTLKEAGVIFTEPSDEFYKELKDTAQPIVEEYKDTDKDCSEIYNNLQKILKKY